MTSLVSRAPLALGLATGLLCACTHPKQAGRETLADTVQRDSAPRPTAPPHPGVVTAEDLERTPSDPIEIAIMSRFPGVVVTRTPDGGLSIRIRGASTILGSTEPLYILDGLPIQSGPLGGLLGIDPHDIQSIEILKDAAATSLYGARGANGVIIIKTKQPDQ